MHRTFRRAHSLPWRTVPLWFVAAFTVWAMFASMPALLSEDAFAQEPVVVPVRVALSHRALGPGESGFLAVIYDVPPSAHLQIGDFLTATPEEGQPFTLGMPEAPPPQEYEGDPVYQGRAIFRYPMTVASDATPGPRTLRVMVGYQACTEEPIFACYAPEEVMREASFEVSTTGGTLATENAEFFPALVSPSQVSSTQVSSTPVSSTQGGAAGSSAPPAAEAPKDLAGRLNQALAERSFLAFLFVFLGGVATSFTPCVYPMIPITISYIGGRSRSRLQGFVLSAFFVLGIAIMYSSLGVLAASTGALFGNAMQSTPVLLIVSAVFFAMGASMLGAFDIALPSSLQTKIQGGPRGGVIGAIAMGMVTGLVASPCVGPVLVVLLAWVANVGAIGYGFWLLFTFATGLGLLFLIIGTFAGALNALPGAGAWMDTVKHVFGVILFAMGIYYLRALIGPGWTWVLSGILVVMTGTFLGAFRPIKEDSENGVLFRKGFGLVLLLGGAFVFLVGLARVSGVGLGAPPVSAGLSATTSQPAHAATAKHPGPDWTLDEDAAWRRASAEGKPVVMDFYADWCVACVELDHKTWVDARIQGEAERFVAIKLDFTKNDAADKARQAHYGVVGLPTVIFFDSEGKEVERFFGFRGPDQVLASMKRVS